MKYELYSKVILITGRYTDEGVAEGTIGIVLEDNDTGDYEIQFLDEDGEPTDIFFAVNETEIMPFVMGNDMDCTVYFIKEGSYEELNAVVYNALKSIVPSEAVGTDPHVESFFYIFSRRYINATVYLPENDEIAEDNKKECEKISQHYNININCSDVSIQASSGNEGVVVFLKFAGELLRRIPGDMAILLDTDTYALVLRRNGEIVVNEFGSDIFDYDYGLLGLPYRQFTEQDR